MENIVRRGRNKAIGITNASQRAAVLNKDVLTGRYEDVRRIYPAKHWILEERTVSPYKSATRKSS